MQSLTVTPGSDGVLATIELDPNAEIDALPDGIYAQVAVYSDHFAHVSVMRKVLLRMTSWMHYLYLDHYAIGGRLSRTLTCLLSCPEPYSYLCWR